MTSRAPGAGLRGLVGDTDVPPPDEPLALAEVIRAVACDRTWTAWTFIPAPLLPMLVGVGLSFLA